MSETELNIVNLANSSNLVQVSNGSSPEYNTSNADDHSFAGPDVSPPEYPDEIILWALIDGFLCLAIVSGNVLTITAILKSRRISHVVSNQFILSLAISDLLVGLFLPYHMSFYIQPELGKDFAWCIARLALMSLACIASVLNIIAIAVDRFTAIVYPLHYNKFMTKR